MKFKVGDRVKWVAIKRAGKTRSEPIKCQGKIVSLKNSVFGGKRKDWGASIKVATKSYKEIWGKDWAFVSFAKLEAVK